jgi:predicted Zn-dependent protease
LSFRHCVCAALVLLLAGQSSIAAAESTEVYIRDTEIESDVQKMSAPVWKSAGLDPSEVHVYLVQDKRLNSFVAGGQNLFLNTGLVMRAENANQLIGVIAHETGHIAGGHLARLQEAMRNASIAGIIGMVVGAAAAVVARGSGSSGAAGGIMMGGMGVAQNTFLQYSIAQEASADQAALSYLDRTGQSARGLLKFFEILQGEELLAGLRQDPYLRTHPLTQQRVEYVRNHVEHSRYSSAADPPGYADMFARIKVKLGAFIAEPATTLQTYSERDVSPLARYARAIAYYRMPKLDKALPIVDGLIRDFPNDPYFRELKGQMLFENGRIKDAMEPYENAVRLAPTAPLLRISLAQVYVESNEPGLNKRAIAYLNDALRSEDKEVTAWHILAAAYGRDNQFGKAALSLAEEGLAGGKKREAMQQAQRAKQLLTKDSASYNRAEEIYRQAEKLE